MTRPVLSRRLVLEAPDRVPDGAGGYSRDLGRARLHVWADVAPRGAGREVDAAASRLMPQDHGTRRAAGRALAAHATMRFRDGARLLPDRSGDRGGCRWALPSVFRQRGDGRMSYGSAMALQEAVYAALRADTVVVMACRAARFSTRCRPGAVPGLHVSLGPERVRPRSDKTGPARCTSFRSRRFGRRGFGTAKALAVAVSDALDRAPVACRAGPREPRFPAGEGAAHRRPREIELWFRARIDLAPV
jgi:hypothetical protein